MQDEQKHWDLFVVFFLVVSFLRQKAEVIWHDPQLVPRQRSFCEELWKDEREHLGPEHLDTLNSLLNLGDLLTHKRQFEEAKGNLWEPYGDKEGILQ